MSLWCSKLLKQDHIHSSISRKRWAGALMELRSLFGMNSAVKKTRDGTTDRWTDPNIVACSRLKLTQRTANVTRSANFLLKWRRKFDFPLFFKQNPNVRILVLYESQQCLCKTQNAISPWFRRRFLIPISITSPKIDETMQKIRRKGTKSYIYGVTMNWHPQLTDASIKNHFV